MGWRLSYSPLPYALACEDGRAFIGMEVRWWYEPVPHPRPKLERQYKSVLSARKAGL